MKHEKIALEAVGEALTSGAQTVVLAAAASGHRASRRTRGAALAYLHGGRFVSTDNAYIHATIVPITAQVSGPISAVEIRTTPG